MRSRQTDTEQQILYDKQISRVEELFQNFQALYDDKNKSSKLFIDNQNLLSSYKEIIFLCNTKPFDNECVYQYIDQSELRCQMNMQMYNLLRPTVITRSRDYIPQIIQFIEKIHKLGYAYEINSSIYFNKSKFYAEHSDSQVQLDSIANAAATLNKKEEQLTTPKYTSKNREKFR
ncbi:unnamed protein product [Rotaria sp. Silwood1]|nr:unnamed protein product [Rotaria sp. Silwood1]CAF1687070.1 unnamed protein product [Rotaria sp. Silwood1]